MGKLVCEICGGSLIMNADNVAECESCGMKYAKEKVASMVKIDGAVEITQGEAEKERLLKNAETFLQLGKHIEAEDLCKKIVNEYPNDYLGWYLSFVNIVVTMDKSGVAISGFRNFLDEADMNLKTAIKLVANKEGLEKQGKKFWLDSLHKGNVNLSTLYNACNDDNYIVKEFLKECDSIISKLVNQLNACLNKKDICNNLGFSYRKNAEDSTIDSFSFKNNCIYANGTVLQKKYIGRSLWNGQSKFKYVDEYEDDISHICIANYNELKKLSETVNKIVGEV